MGLNAPKGNDRIPTIHFQVLCSFQGGYKIIQNLHRIWSQAMRIRQATLFCASGSRGSPRRLEKQKTWCVCIYIYIYFFFLHIYIYIEIWVYLFVWICLYCQLSLLSLTTLNSKSNFFDMFFFIIIICIIEDSWIQVSWFRTNMACIVFRRIYASTVLSSLLEHISLIIIPAPKNWPPNKLRWYHKIGVATEPSSLHFGKMAHLLWDLFFGIHLLLTLGKCPFTPTNPMQTSAPMMS